MGERVRVKVQKADRTIEIEASPEQIEASLSLVDQLLAKLPSEGMRDSIEVVSSPAISGPAEETEALPSVTGSSLPDGIMQLLSSDWGRRPRTVREIAEALELNGMHYTLQPISTALLRLTKQGRLRRLKKDDVYSYVAAKR